MAEPEEPRKYDLVDAWDRAQHLMVPRATFPLFAAFFVLLCGGMAFVLFAVGRIFGGLLFSGVVVVGLYVAYNNVRAWTRRGRLADVGSTPGESV